MPRWSPFEPYFWSKVEKTETCWLWTGGVYGGGYGRVRRGNKESPAHRVAYELTNGPIQDGLQACHHCDNKLCVNPAHIFLGTQKDNMQDCAKKGRNVLINNPQLWDNGRHWKNNKKARAKLSNLRKQELRTGVRVVIRGEKGRIMGHRIVNK